MVLGCSSPPGNRSGSRVKHEESRCKFSSNALRRCFTISGSARGSLDESVSPYTKKCRGSSLLVHPNLGQTLRTNCCCYFQVFYRLLTHQLLSLIRQLIANYLVAYFHLFSISFITIARPQLQISVIIVSLLCSLISVVVVIIGPLYSPTFAIAVKLLY